MNLPHDFKNWRAPRSSLRHVFIVAALLSIPLVAGPIDYAYQLDLESQNKMLRVELAILKRPRASMEPPAPRCRGEKTREWHAWQADGGEWVSVCRDGRIKFPKENS